MLSFLGSFLVWGSMGIFHPFGSGWRACLAMIVGILLDFLALENNSFDKNCHDFRKFWSTDRVQVVADSTLLQNHMEAISMHASTESFLCF